MVSTCPSCKKKVEHEDYLFEVGCECGMRFNPFYDPAANVDGGGHSEAVAEEPVAQSFTESNTAFKEIVDFGESLVEEKPAGAKAAPAKAAPAPAKAAAPAIIPGSVEATSAILVGAGNIDGYRIDEYYLPVSTSVGVELEAPNPLRQAYENLWNQCQAMGANAVVSVSWAFTPDGARCLVTGTPVRATKS